MERQQVRERIRELTLAFFQAKLGLTPRSVEVRGGGDTLEVRVRGFFAPAEKALIDHPKERRAIEDYYLRLFDQLLPLLNAGVGKAGPIVRVQTLPDLRGNECVFMVTLGKESEVIIQNPAEAERQ